MSEVPLYMAPGRVARNKALFLPPSRRKPLDASERRGAHIKGFKDFNLNAKARIWSLLSCMWLKAKARIWS